MKILGNIMRSVLLAVIGLTLLLSLTSCEKSGDKTSGGTPKREAMIKAVDVRDSNGKSVALSSSIDSLKLTVSVLVEEGSDLSGLKFYPTLSSGASV